MRSCTSRRRRRRSEAARRSRVEAPHAAHAFRTYILLTQIAAARRVEPNAPEPLFTSCVCVCGSMVPPVHDDHNSSGVCVLHSKRRATTHSHKSSTPCVKCAAAAMRIVCVQEPTPTHIQHTDRPTDMPLTYYTRSRVVPFTDRRALARTYSEYVRISRHLLSACNARTAKMRVARVMSAQ